MGQEINIETENEFRNTLDTIEKLAKLIENASPYKSLRLSIELEEATEKLGYLKDRTKVA